MPAKKPRFQRVKTYFTKQHQRRFSHISHLLTVITAATVQMRSRCYIRLSVLPQQMADVLAEQHVLITLPHILRLLDSVTFCPRLSAINKTPDNAEVSMDAIKVGTKAYI